MSRTSDSACPRAYPNRSDAADARLNNFSAPSVSPSRCRRSPSTSAEVDSALVLGDLLHRDGDTDGALKLFKRASAASDRLGYARGQAESLVREIDLSKGRISDQQLIDLQRRALVAAQSTGEQALSAHILIDLAENEARAGDLAGAVEHLEESLELSRRLGDLTMENQALEMLSAAERQLGRKENAVSRNADRVRIGSETNAPSVVGDAIEYGTQLLELHRADEARSVFLEAIAMASRKTERASSCLLYTSDAADDLLCVD